MAEQRHTKEDLKMLQALPLNLKIRLTEDRIRAWVHEFGEEGVCVSFSGGKDSTVLLHIVRNLYPKVKAVFSNTGLEYPEIQRFVRGFENTDIIVPEINFRDVVTQFGYPLIGKEVAEAIYYASKLRGGWNRTGNAENCTDQEDRNPGRQTDWKRRELWGGAYPLIPTSRAANRRTVIQGRMPGSGGGGLANASTRTSTIRSTERTFGTDGPYAHRQLLEGKYKQIRRRTELKGGGATQTKERTSRGREWQDWRRGCL